MRFVTLLLLLIVALNLIVPSIQQPVKPDATRLFAEKDQTNEVRRDTDDDDDNDDDDEDETTTTTHIPSTTYYAI